MDIETENVINLVFPDGIPGKMFQYYDQYEIPMCQYY